MPVILHHGPPALSLPFEERIRHSRMAGCLVVVPTKRRIRHLTREIMRLSPGAVAPALPLHTLESLCRMLYGALPSSRPVLGGALRTLLFQTAAASVAGSLRFFTPRSSEPVLPRGTFARVVDVIVLLKESGVYAAQLDEELESALPGEQAKLRDVTAIYHAYERFLDATESQDLEGVYRALSLEIGEDLFHSKFKCLFPDVGFVSLAGFDEFSLPEIRILRRISTLPNVSVTLMFDYLPGNRELFGHLEENYRLFAEMGFREIRGDAVNASAFFFGFTRKPPAAKEAADHLARTLFMRGGGPGKWDISSTVTVMAARNRVHEIELACKLIRRLIADRPERLLGSICLAIQRPDLYTEIVRQQFARFEIPANITDRFELERSPLVVHLMGLLEIPLRGFRRRDVLRVVGSPYFHIPVGRETFDAANLAAVAARVRVTAGIQSWLGRIDGAIACAERLRKGKADRVEHRSTETEIASLRKGRADIEALIGLLAPFGGSMTSTEFVRSTLELIECLEVPGIIVKPAIGGANVNVEREVRAFTTFREVIESLGAIAAMEGESKTKRPLRFHLERLRIAVSRERYNVREQFGRGVLVTSIEETRELPVDVMIVAGLVDGEFPSVYHPEVFFSSHRMKAREMRHAWENRYLFYQAVTNWTEHLYLSYPLQDGENELVRSPFIEAVLASSVVDRLEGTEGAPWNSDVGSQEEFLRLYATGEPGCLEPPPSPLSSEVKYVRHAAAVERGRISDEQLGRYRGSISKGLNEQERIELRALGARTYSVSQLESYAGCPFRYFAESVLRLKESESFDETLSPLEKGSILHAALHEFYSERRQKRLPPIRDLSATGLQDAVRELTAIVRSRLAEIPIPEPFWELEQELILGSPDGEGGLLREFLEFEHAREDVATPSFFEVGFGGGAGLPGDIDALLSREEPIILGGVSLRGKIDRVDTGEDFFVVVDYKTGSKVSGLEDMREGLSLQLPVYMHAVEHLLQASGRSGFSPAGGLYYRLRSPVELVPGAVADTFRGKAFPQRSRTKQTVESTERLRDVINAAEDTIRSISAQISVGEFPLARTELVPEVCRMCTYKTICRIQLQKHVSPMSPEEQ
jgi:ATP-dependent helicase/nuclease subunit B